MPASAMALEPAPDVIFRALDDGAVLVHLPANEIYELNETGALVWSRLVDGAPAAAIVDALVEAFDVDAATAERAVDDMIAQFIAQGLVRA